MRRPRRPSLPGEKAWSERGFALVAVIMTIAVLSLFLLTALAYALNGMNPSRRDQDAKSAEQAALAGVDEYISRLNTDDNYWAKGDTGDSTNAAFTSAGQPVQGTGGAASTAARFTYSVRSTDAETARTGIIRLRVTGASGMFGNAGVVTRTVTAELKRAGLLNYVYLSDIEVTDPDLGGDKSCAYYYYKTDTTPARPSSCSGIQWTGRDTVNGPLHSNDALQINTLTGVSGAVNFTNVKTESSWPAIQGLTSNDKTWYGTQAKGTLPGYTPKYAKSVTLPTSNNDLLKYVNPDVDGDGAVGPGCYYTGATRIILQGTTMKVLSPSTTRSDIPSSCYNRANPKVEQTVAIPPVIHVDPTASSCTLGAVGYPASGEWYSSSKGANAVAWTGAQGGDDASVNYHCSRGSVYISGTSSTPVTISAADDVVVVGDLQPDSVAGTNVIGLIAGNCIWIWHPVKSGNVNANLYSTAPVSTVRAAMLALRHSIVVQNWFSGTQLSDLNITGAMAQKFRGPVGGTYNGVSRGYGKNYVYDQRVAYSQPPYFLNADNAPFQVLRMTDG